LKSFAYLVFTKTSYKVGKESCSKVIGSYRGTSYSQGKVVKVSHPLLLGVAKSMLNGNALC
jgi:hypothetical protein